MNLKSPKEGAYVVQRDPLCDVWAGRGSEWDQRGSIWICKMMLYCASESILNVTLIYSWESSIQIRDRRLNQCGPCYTSFNQWKFSQWFCVQIKRFCRPRGYTPVQLYLRSDNGFEALQKILAWPQNFKTQLVWLVQREGECGIMATECDTVAFMK